MLETFDGIAWFRNGMLIAVYVLWHVNEDIINSLGIYIYIYVWVYVSGHGNPRNLWDSLWGVRGPGSRL